MALPNSVTIIGEAFIGCKKLITVTIPESVKDIGNNAFAQCENIEDVFCFAEKLPKQKPLPLINHIQNMQPFTFQRWR
ncbi:MAG: leucine-rich repeat protein [Bacteroidaceae bacterium]|nr:leucine-rich repeat protein [Bacteroidaceae bacterium]